MSSSARFEVDVRVGRLVEARVLRLATAEDADAYGLAVASAARSTGARPVLVADHRAVLIYPQPAADRLVELFRPNNTRFARIAVVVSPANATLLLQLERLVREARSDHRRVCRTADEALAHVKGDLDHDELVRARVFLSETQVATASGVRSDPPGARSDRPGARIKTE